MDLFSCWTWKRLFPHRALKTRGNTPKYGLIFHSSFIGRAAAKNKGRISRYLANKCTIASRIDCFSGERSWTLLLFYELLVTYGVTAMMLTFFVNSIHPSGWCWDANSWAHPCVFEDVMLRAPAGLVFIVLLLCYRGTNQRVRWQAARSGGGAAIVLRDRRGTTEKCGRHEGGGERGERTITCSVF